MDPKLCLIVIYIRYWSVIDSLQQNVELTLEFDSKGVSTLMGPSGPYFELIYHDDMVYDGWISSRFIFLDKSVLVITQGCIWENEQSFQIGLID